jgi:predicted exporter
MRFPRFNWPLLMLTLVLIGALFWASLRLTTIDTDITRYLPQGDPVLSDAGTIFAHHPIQGEMVIDLGLETADPDLLVRSCDFIEGRMRESGLFTRVGAESMQALIPELLTHITDHLPMLFTQAELEGQVARLLTAENIANRLGEIRNQLLTLDAIGQASRIARDPLAIGNIIMAKLAVLAPSRDVAFYRGKLLSMDHKHALIVASPISPGTDTAFALKIDTFLRALAAELPGRFDPGNPLTLTPMGAYRAALDNERFAKKDVQNAALFSTLGIALLLLLVFPRPLIGLFSFLPAVAGTVAALFVMALLNKSISIMALGFGGAIISITVDQGIAYLLFLDQPRTTYGHEVSTEIWGIELMVTLTTVGAFYALCFTGFPILSQLGQFAALGASFAFLFVHFLFPRIFPEMPPARPRALPFRNWVMRLTVSRKWAAVIALFFFGVMLFFVRPVFNTDLAAMNTVSRETSAAEILMSRVWGSGIFNKIYLMTEASSPVQLQEKGDTLLTRIEADMQDGRIASGFTPAMVFPGPERSRDNFSAWKAFWTDERIAATGEMLTRQSQALGFTADAFDAFRQMISSGTPPAPFLPIPEKYFSLMGITRLEGGGFSAFTTLTPGETFDSQKFFERHRTDAKIFDPALFSRRLGELLFSTFAKMLLVAGTSVALLIFIFLLDVKLTAITLSPAIFAFVCTMGTLKVIGHPLDIPALMLAIIIMGMGVDYALLLVCSYQRFGGLNEPGCERIKMALIMAALSTLIGFGVLCLADHSLLRSAGITSFLGIGYSLAGAFVLLPPLLEHHFRKDRERSSASNDWRKRVLDRYRSLETYPRLFARFKTKNDVMFSELPRFLAGCGQMRTVLDVGCGYGVPGCWILEHFPGARIYGNDPDRERIRVAERVFGERGKLTCAAAPEIPQAPEAADAAFLLDIVHFLDDTAFRLTLARLRKSLHADAVLILRAVVPPPGETSRLWKLDAFRMRLTGIPVHHRSVELLGEMITESGFELQEPRFSGGNRESVWLIARAAPGVARNDE